MLIHPSTSGSRVTAGRNRRAFLVWTMMYFCLAGLVFGQDSGNEYQKKAVHIGKLARYVEWPKDKMGTGIPLVIGVFGTDFASDQIREVVGRKPINGREVVVKTCSTIQEAAGCHMLFVSRSEEGRLSAILRKVRGEPVLTAGECDSFLKEGGIINLRTFGNEVNMEINEKNARRSDLKISPRLVNFGEGGVGG